MITTRIASSADRDFLADMLVEAINWDPERPAMSRDQVLELSENQRYVDDWPRPGEIGVVAEDPSGAPVGAAWWRCFSSDEPGYGFIAEDVPEIAIGVVAARRGQGIGDRLLDELEGEARRLGIRSLSLSVEPTNPALRLYVRHGYREVGGSSGSNTMRLDLAH